MFSNITSQILHAMPTITLRHLAFIAAIMTPLIASSQNGNTGRMTKEATVDNYFTAKYEVLASDSSTKDGKYTLYYRDAPIESGEYKMGKKSGIWEYRNLRKMTELKYDHTARRPTYMLPHEGHKYNTRNYPCTFIGSPLIPFFFIHTRAYYPKAEADNPDGGNVILRLMISPQGKLTSFMIKQATSENFAEVVRKAAIAIPKDKWRWVPAMKDGKRVEGTYDITILFDNE